MVNQLRTRKKEQKEGCNKTNSQSSNNSDSNPNEPKFGFAPNVSPVRVFTKLVIFTAVLIIAWFYSKYQKELALAKADQKYELRSQSIDCDLDYLAELKQYSDCMPKRCGRFVSDEIVSSEETEILLWLAKRGTSLSEPAGGVSIMDLHSGTLTYEDYFINFYKAFQQEGFLTETDLVTYQSVRVKIRNAVAKHFGIKSASLYLTYPTFFSKLTNKKPVSPNDEYWKVHVDKYTYKLFHYTTLLYLNNYNDDFTGGRFIFVNNNNKRNISVEPRSGRVSMFTSGSENPHYVERVETGERYAITIAFTCDKTAKIQNPVLDDEL